MQDNKLTKDELIGYVQKGKNPKLKNWILFENGTHIFFDETTDANEIEVMGIEKMKKFGPVHGGSSAGDFQVFTLNDSLGWVVAGHGPRIYTYIHPSEMGSENPDDLGVGLYGRDKRNMDGLNPIVICISWKGEIIKK